MTSSPTHSTRDSEPAIGESLIEIKDLEVEFPTTAGLVRPLEGVSLSVSAGETLAVLGESGSGKSVTAQAIMGLLPKIGGRITGGQILYRGTDLVQKPLRYTRNLCGTEIAMIFQDPLSSLNPVFTVGYQIAEPLRRRRGVRRREARDRAIQLMDRVGIPDPQRRVDDFPHQFSGGMRQRVMIALALALDPTVLIADEPTTALDVTVQAQIMDLLAEIQAETGMGMVLITHDLGVVADKAQRAAIMYSGRVVETGPIRRSTTTQRTRTPRDCSRPFLARRQAVSPRSRARLPICSTHLQDVALRPDAPTQPPPAGTTYLSSVAPLAGPRPNRPPASGPRRC